MKYGSTTNTYRRVTSGLLTTGRSSISLPEDETLTLLPNVGDFVSLDQSIPASTMLGVVSFHGRVKSRVFRYVLANEKEQWCQINIVVEQTDDDWGALSKSSAALLVIVGLSSSPALAAPVPRQFDFACKTEIAKRLNFKIVSERPSKPLTLHVDLDRQVWCQDRCSKRYAIQGVQETRLPGPY